MKMWQLKFWLKNTPELILVCGALLILLVAAVLVGLLYLIAEVWSREFKGWLDCLKKWAEWVIDKHAAYYKIDKEQQN